MASVLISGCVAYDSVWHLDGRFDDGPSIFASPTDRSFVASSYVAQLGGCAANVSHGVALLGHTPLPVAAAGANYAAHEKNFVEKGIDGNRIRIFSKSQTPRSVILSDTDGTQVTAFDLGAAALTAEVGIGSTDNIALGVVAPSVPQAALRHTMEMVHANIPVLAIPGQAVSRFSRADLAWLVDNSTFLIVNESEARIIRTLLGMSDFDLSQRLDAYVVTRGVHGSILHVGSDTLEIGSIEVNITDPTGCGDAYVAACAAAVLSGLDWPTPCRAGSIMAAVCGQSIGAQTYVATVPSTCDQFEIRFGYRPNWSS